MNFSGALAYYLEFLILLLTTITILPIIGVLAVIIAWKLSLVYSQAKLSTQIKGRHCLVTGASQGLGKAIALELVKAGAHVTILSRSIDKLQIAVNELEKSKINPDQIIQFKAVDLISYQSTLKIAQELARDGHSPEWVVCTAGSSVPGYLIDQLPKKNKDQYQDDAHEWMMDSNYLTSVNVTRALLEAAEIPRNSKSKISGICTSKLDKLPSRIILVGSVLSVLSMIGYSAYSGSKYALRGFADALRSELTPLGIKVSLYLPGNIDTPGFVSETKTKPKITQEIEGASALASPEQAAQDMLAGVMNNRYYVSNDLLGELARVSVNGGAPRPNLMIEVPKTK